MATFSFCSSLKLYGYGKACDASTSPRKMLAKNDMFGRPSFAGFAFLFGSAFGTAARHLLNRDIYCNTNYQTKRINGNEI